jgi:hypothetical protein
MTLLLLDYTELANVGNDKAMTLTSCCTCIRAEVTTEHKETAQHCTDFKVRTFRDTLTVAQLSKNLTTTSSANITDSASLSLHAKCCRLAQHKEK